MKLATRTRTARLTTYAAAELAISRDRWSQTWASYQVGTADPVEVHTKSMFTSLTRAQELALLWQAVNDRITAGADPAAVFADAIREVDVRITEPIGMGDRTADADVDVRRAAAREFASSLAYALGRV